MLDNTSVLETQARNLKSRLHQMWDETEPDSPHASRLVILAERAHSRHIRRAARCGDPVAQRWLALMQRANAHEQSVQCSE